MPGKYGLPRLHTWSEMPRPRSSSPSPSPRSRAESCASTAAALVDAPRRVIVFFLAAGRDGAGARLGGVIGHLSCPPPLQAHAFDGNVAGRLVVADAEEDRL